MKTLITHFNAGPSAKGIANHSLEIRAPISSNVSLSCWIDYDDSCPDDDGGLLWKFNDGLLWKLNNKPESLPASGKKYNVERKDTNTRCKKELILSIFDVTGSDEGTYSCHWLCEYESTSKAAIDLKVDVELQTGKNSLNFCFTIKSFQLHYTDKSIH